MTARTKPPISRRSPLSGRWRSFIATAVRAPDSLPGCFGSLVTKCGMHDAESGRGLQFNSSACAGTLAIHLLPKGPPELQLSPSPTAAATIDRRITVALGAQPFGGDRAERWRRRLTLAPIAAVVAALVLGTVVVAAALVLTADDQRVYDVTACMRSRGWEVADPNVEDGTGHVVPGFSTTVDDARQQAFNADLEECATNAGIPLER